MSDVYYHAIIIPKRDIDRVTISHVYFPRETMWEVKKGRPIAKEVFSHESTFEGVYCVVGYYLPESEGLIGGSGNKIAKVLTDLGPQSLGGDAWRIPVPSFHIEFAKKREANSHNNPFKPTQFKRGDLVQSNEWFLAGKTFRVTYCKPHVTTAREISSGHLFSLRTLNLSLIK